MIISIIMMYACIYDRSHLIINTKGVIFWVKLQQLITYNQINYSVSVFLGLWAVLTVEPLKISRGKHPSLCNHPPELTLATLLGFLSHS